jgi:hypothetical protein
MRFDIAPWKFLSRWFAVSALGWLLAGCGGGGGGSTSPEAQAAVPLQLSNVRVSGATQDTIASTSTLGSVYVFADLTGTLSALNGQTIFIVVEDPEQLFNEFGPTFTPGTNGLDNALILRGNVTYGRVGHYLGSLRVHVCLDLACKREMGASPLLVPYDITIRPGVRFQADSPLTVAADFGTVPAALRLPYVIPQGATPEWTTSVSFSDGGLYSPGPDGTPKISGQNLDEVVLPLLLAPVGTHAIRLFVDGRALGSDGVLPLHTELQINYVVRPVAGRAVAFSPPAADFVGSSGGVFTSDHLVVGADGTRYGQVSRVVYLPAGGGNLDAGSSAWLDVSPTLPFTFRLTGRACPNLVSNCLAAGRYSAEVFFKSSAGVESPQALAVTMTVN